MYLRDIQFVPNAPGDFRDNNLALRMAADHVTEIFRTLLPRKYYLNGAGKIVIELGSHRPCKARYTEGLGVGTFWWPNFELRSFLAMGERQQEERALEILSAVLTELAKTGGGDAQTIRQVTGHLRELGYRLTVPLRCSKSHPSRRWRAEVILTYRRGGADVDVVLRSRSKEELARKAILRDSSSHEVWNTCWRGTWKGDAYRLYDRFGKEVVELGLPAVAA